MLCELCGVNEVHNQHHLIPKTCHSNKWFKKRYSKEEMNQTIGICRGCHRCLNKLFPYREQKQLGKQYPTVELMLTHPVIAKHVEWSQAHPGVLGTR